MKEEMATAKKKKKKTGGKEVQREGRLPRLRASLSGCASACVLWDLPPGVRTVAPCDCRPPGAEGFPSRLQGRKTEEGKINRG